MKDSERENSIIAIAGPTASGKTALAVAVAQGIGAEVVNYDSVQIYREIEIATAKPTADEMQGVPHHLIDYVDPRRNYTAADWARDADAAIREIESRGHPVVLVGGTGFYLRTLMNPLFDSPPTDISLRQRLQDLRDRKGPEHLHRILGRMDGPSAAMLPVRDHVRVIRALEVFLQTGHRLSDRHSEPRRDSEYGRRIRIFALDPPREQLYSVIDRRTEMHFDRGLVAEVKRLRRQGIGADTNALGSHGYRRVCEYLRGERTLASAIEKTRQDVRNYAKRQITWFRNEPVERWFTEFGDARNVADAIADLALAGPPA